MKTVLEQLMELNDKIEAIGKRVYGETICGDGACGCGCEESPVEVVDEGPEFDVRGFGDVERTVVESAYVVTEDDKYAGHVHLTRAEMIDFATKLAGRIIDKCKEAVTDTNLDADSLVDLSMSYGYQIEIELDQDSIARSIHDEIDGAIDLDPDSVSDEIDDIFGDMYLERIS
jgi:hypothetical protein